MCHVFEAHRVSWVMQRSSLRVAGDAFFFTDKLDHFADGLVQADEEAAGHDRMADVQFFDFGDVADVAGVDVVQAVAGGDGDAQVAAHRGSGAYSVEFADRAGGVFCVGVKAGVDFDLFGAAFDGSADLVRVGVDEQADPDAGLVQAVHGGGDFAFAADHRTGCCPRHGTASGC